MNIRINGVKNRGFLFRYFIICAGTSLVVGLILKFVGHGPWAELLTFAFLVAAPVFVGEAFLFDWLER